MIRHGVFASRFVLGFVLGILLLHSVLLLQAVGRDAKPMWDEAWSLWNSLKFTNQIRLNGIEALLQYKSAKPWLIEFIYFPFQFFGSSSMRIFLLPSMIAYCMGVLLLVVAGLKRFSVLPCAGMSLAYAAAYRMGVFSISTQVESFLCLGITLFIFSTFVETKWKSLVLGFGFILLMLGKQSSIIFILGMYLLYVSYGKGGKLEKISVVVKSAAIGSVVVVPVYLLNMRDLIAYARFVRGLRGEPFYQFVRTFLFDSLGIFACLVIVTSIILIIPGGQWQAKWKIGVFCSVIAAWFIFLGIVLQHNVFKYILPAIPVIAATPLFLFKKEKHPPPRRMTWGLWSFILLLLIVQLAALNVWSRGRQFPFLQQRVAFGFSNGDFCNEFVRKELKRLDGGNMRIGIVGDHCFLNYMTVNWYLEQLGLSNYQVAYIRLPLEEETPDVKYLIVNSIPQHNLIEQGTILAFRNSEEFKSKWVLISGCSRFGGQVEIFSSKREIKK